jgi:sugar/nucleoside kinase (ribokinase family)
LNPKFITISNIFIDDIVKPDGITKMGTLGGAGTHAMIGMRVWTKDIGIVASVGEDFKQDFRDQLKSIEVDLRGIITRPGCQTTRAWQIFEWDEKRIEVMRVDYVNYSNFLPKYEDLPKDYRNSLGYHIHLNVSLDELYNLFIKLKEDEPQTILLWEPTDPQANIPAKELHELLQIVDVFSPNNYEAKFITGVQDCHQAANILANFGANIVAIRCGIDGSFVRDQNGVIWHIPAISERVIDVTGAGNAYCGGFLVGLVCNESAKLAGLCGAVSASFAIQQFGVPDSIIDFETEAKLRFDFSKNLIKKL